MRLREITEGVGRITKQNQTVDVGPDAVTKQAAKFGNKVDKDGRPPTLSKKVKGKSTNVLYNLGLAEGYKLQLERDKEMLVLNITDTATGKRTEVRGKPGYETNYDPNDSLHILLDKVGKSANISDLMNGEVVSINPNHPDATKAKAATDVAYNEALDQPYAVRWSIQDDDEWFAWAKDDKMQIQIKTIADGRWVIRFKVREKMDKTGEGDQFRIFATVKAAIQEWWTWASKNAEVNVITFSADKIVDSSRSKLYHRFAQQFARAIGYEMKVNPGRNDDIFYIEKPGVKENFADGKKKIQEALDQPYTVRWTMKDDDEWEGKAKTEAGDSIQIMITQGHNNHKWEIDFYVGGSMQVTGKGDQFRVFATVVSAVKEWWSWLSKSKQPVEAIIFSAFKGNKSAKGSAGRSNLYNRFANQFARSIGFTVSTVDGSDNIKFVLANPNYKDQQTENFADGKEIGIHRSAEDFAVIDLSKSADGTFWLNGVDNTDWDNTVTTGQGVDMAFEISPQAKLASYDDIDKYSVGELENMGYDGVRMVDGDNIAYQIWNTKILKRTQLGENFADGKKKGKSRPGRVKRSGASCNGSVTALRKRAKNASGEKAKMYHWCANMKSGRKKK